MMMFPSSNILDRLRAALATEAWGLVWDFVLGFIAMGLLGTAFYAVMLLAYGWGLL